MYDRILYKDHGEAKRREEGLSTADVRTVLKDGLVLRHYPDDQPYPSRLVLGWIDGPARLETYEEGRPIHVVAADDDEQKVTWIVTTGLTQIREVIPGSTRNLPDNEQLAPTRSRIGVRDDLLVRICVSPDDLRTGPRRMDRSIQMEEPMEKPREHLEGMSDLEGTSCFNCPEGEYRISTTTRTLEDGETVLVVKEVPALVCDKCGDAAFSEAVSEHLEELIDEAVAAGVESEVRRYRAPQEKTIGHQL